MHFFFYLCATRFYLPYRLLTSAILSKTQRFFDVVNYKNKIFEQPLKKKNKYQLYSPPLH